MLTAGWDSFLWVRRLSRRHFDPRRFGFGMVYSFFPLRFFNTSNAPRGGPAGQEHGSRFRFAPQDGQIPPHPSEQITFTGSSRATCSQNISLTSSPLPL